MLWDTDKDLVILLGDAAHVAAAIGKLGQRKILLYSHRDIASTHGRVVHSPKELHESILALPGRAPEQCIIQRVDDSFTPAEVTQIRALATNSLATLTCHHATIDTFGPLWLEQGLANMTKIAELPFTPTIKNARGRPAVIVSLGPSLSKNAHLLRDIKSRAIIVACSHALEALHKIDIIPDVVIALDAQDIRYHFRGGLGEGVHILAVTPTVHPSLLDLANLQWFASVNDFEAWLSKGKVLKTGGTVAGACLSLTHTWGCSPIVLVGQDYAFEEDRFYSSLSIDGELRVKTDGDVFRFENLSRDQTSFDYIERGEQHIHRVRGYYDGEVVTSTTFLRALRWTEEFIVETGADVWNSTEGGAMIHGARKIALKNAIKHWSAFDVKAALSGANRLPYTMERAASIRGDLTDCGKAAQRCLDNKEDTVRLKADLRERMDKLGWFFALAARAKLAALHDKMIEADGKPQAQLAVSREVWTLIREVANHY